MESDYILRHYDLEDGTEIDVFSPSDYPWLCQVIHYRWPEIPLIEEGAAFPHPKSIQAETLFLSKRFKTSEKAFATAKARGAQ